MSNKENRAIELVDLYRKELNSNQRLLNAMNTEGKLAVIYGHLPEAAKIAEIFSQIIDDVKADLADINTIKNSLKDDMQYLLTTYNDLCDNQKPFIKIKEFLKDNN